MDQDPLFYMSLGQAWRELVYTANCLTCREIRRIDLKALAGKLGEDYPLLRIREKLRCSKCGGKNITIATRLKASTTSTETLQRFPFEYD